jgi:hypothetical protein
MTLSSRPFVNDDSETQNEAENSQGQCMVFKISNVKSVHDGLRGSSGFLLNNGIHEISYFENPDGTGELVIMIEAEKTAILIRRSMALLLKIGEMEKTAGTSGDSQFSETTEETADLDEEGDENITLARVRHHVGVVRNSLTPTGFPLEFGREGETA